MVLVDDGAHLFNARGVLMPPESQVHDFRPAWGEALMMWPERHSHLSSPEPS